MQMREQLAANAAILKRLAEIDKSLLEHDSALRPFGKNCSLCSRHRLTHRAAALALRPMKSDSFHA
jgi:predicted transcriptional regulator